MVTINFFHLSFWQVPDVSGHEPEDKGRVGAELKVEMKGRDGKDLDFETQVTEKQDLKQEAKVSLLSPQEKMPPLQPAYKLDKVKQKMTLEDLEAAAEEEADDDPDFEVEQEKREKKTSKRGGKGKRKRSDSSDSEVDEDDAMFYPECSLDVESEEAKTKKSKGVSVNKKPPKKRKKKRLEEIEEDGGGEDGERMVKEEGPVDMNLFALGFEETEAKDIKVKKTMTQGERLSMKVTSGKASENFMKIDLKKKSFSKGKNSGAKMKRFEYKKKLALKEGTKVKESKCYRCGEVGHWATQCTGGQGDRCLKDQNQSLLSINRLIPEQMAEEFDPGDFPTLDQV